MVFISHVITDFGLTWSFPKFISQYLSKGNNQNILFIFKKLILLQASISVVIFGLIEVVSIGFYFLKNSFLCSFFLLNGIIFLCYRISLAFSGFLWGIGDYSQWIFLKYLREFRFFSLFCVLILGSTGINAIVGIAGGSILSTVISGIFWSRKIKKFQVPMNSSSELKIPENLISFCFHSWINDLAITFNEWIWDTMIALTFTITLVGFYRAAKQLVLPIVIFSQIFSSLLLTSLPKLKTEEINKYIIKNLFGLLILSIILVVVIGLFADEIVKNFLTSDFLVLTPLMLRFVIISTIFASLATIIEGILKAIDRTILIFYNSIITIALVTLIILYVLTSFSYNLQFLLTIIIIINIIRFSYLLLAILLIHHHEVREDFKIPS
jgi:O-antigen/teichoic acid export membrane protein